MQGHEADHPMSATPIILADGVTKRFGANQVLTRVSLPVMERDVVCVVGPSGSGKTTLLRCFALLELPSEGRILMDEDAETLRTSATTVVGPRGAVDEFVRAREVLHRDGVGGLASRPDLVAEFVRMGARYVSTGTDTAFLLAACTQRARQVQEIKL